MKRVLILLLFVLVAGCNNGGPDRGPWIWTCPKCDNDLSGLADDYGASSIKRCWICGLHFHGHPRIAPVRRRKNDVTQPSRRDPIPQDGFYIPENLREYFNNQ